jgi:hypothetical protein
MSGDPLEGNNDRSFWIAPLLGGMIHSVGQTLEEATSKVLEVLLPHSEFFRRFRNDGGSVYLAIGLFGPDNFGIEFDPELLRRLGELGIELGFDIYPGRPGD